MEDNKKGPRSYHYAPKADPVYETIGVFSEAATMARLGGPHGVMVPVRDGAVIVSYKRFRGGVVEVSHDGATIRLSADQAIGLAAAIIGAGRMSRQHKSITWTTAPEAEDNE